MAFWELQVPADVDTSEGLTNFLWEHGALGVVEEDVPGERLRLRAFYAADAAPPPGLLEGVRDYLAALRALGFRVAPGSPELVEVRDAPWASAWEQSFPPRAIGERLLVVPPWEVARRAAGGARVSVVIQPGRAFGTGHHGSTEGCLVLLETAMGRRPARTVLDIGTGTGILAVAAAKLGAERVLGIDVDPDAIAAARASAEANGCAERVELALRGPEDLADSLSFDLLLANLLTGTHLSLWPRYEALAEPGARVILGGILTDEEERLRGALEGSSLSLTARQVVDGWCSLLLTRQPAPVRGAGSLT